MPRRQPASSSSASTCPCTASCRTIRSTRSRPRIPWARRMPALPTPYRVGEPTFNVDYVNNTTTAPGPDGIPDSSGQHFINLASMLTARDNLRQGAANLIALTRAAPSLDLDGDAGAGHRPRAHSLLRLVARRHHRQRLHGHAAARCRTSSRCRCSRRAAESWRRCASRRVIHRCSTTASRPRVSRPARPSTGSSCMPRRRRWNPATAATTRRTGSPSRRSCR